jgi:hypothetical protein
VLTRPKRYAGREYSIAVVAFERRFESMQMEKRVAKEREAPPGCFYNYWTAATSTNVPVCNSCAMYEAMQADIGRISVAGMSCIQVTTVVNFWKSDVSVPS